MTDPVQSCRPRSGGLRLAAHLKPHPARLTPRSQTGFKRQHGMTLVEFMVGITIGLLVVLAAVGSLIMIRSSARTLDDSAGLEQQISLLMMQIGQQIKQTGAINAVATGSANSSPAISFQVPNATPATPFITGNDGANNGSDTVTISYVAPNDNSVAVNCIGENPVTQDDVERVVNVFSVDVKNNLRCGNGQDSPQQIASNVVDFQVWYLMPQGNNIEYLTAQQVQDTASWPNITGLQICLGMMGNPIQAPSQTVKDCQGDSKTYNDGRVYRYVKQVFYLRN